MNTWKGDCIYCENINGIEIYHSFNIEHLNNYIEIGKLDMLYDNINYWYIEDNHGEVIARQYKNNT